MAKQKKLIIKFCAFNNITHEFYLCSSKVDIAKCCGVSTRTILRRTAITSSFMINEWNISVDVEVHKQPIRNDNLFL